MFTREQTIGLALVASFLLSACPAGAGGVLTADRPQATGGYEVASSLAIGGAEAEDDSFFYEKYGSVVVDADGEGRIYVLDNGNIRIQVFDDRGNAIGSLGSEGEGPGEFLIPGKLSVNARGEVAVYDMGTSRISVLDSEGHLLRDQIAGGAVEDIVLRDDGGLFVGYGSRGPALVELYGASGELVWQGGENVAPGGRHINIQLDRQTIAPRLVVLGDGSTFRAPAGEYVVQRFDLSGEQLASFRREFERREISPEEFAPPSDEEGGPQIVMIRKGGGHGDGGGGGEGRPAWEDEEGAQHTPGDFAKYLPKHHPDTRGVLAWPDGRLWVITAEDQRAGAVTDEWSTDGEWLRRFNLPVEYEAVRVGRDGRLYGVTHDEDDYPTVHRIDVRTGA